MTKALLPVKAQPLADDELTAWFEGRVSRRVLSIPFGGPIPSPKSKLGVDLDGEWFDADTDIFGSYQALRETRERLSDWHHTLQLHRDPTGMMTGHAIGKSILDPNPDEDGWWSDFWFRAGEKRVALIKQLAARGAQLFGSSEPIAKGVVRDESGHIRVWPHLIQTLSTSPQNTLSVVRAKALLDDINESGVEVSSQLRDVLGSLDDLGADLTPTRVLGKDAAKAGRVDIERFAAALDDSLEPWRFQP